MITKYTIAKNDNIYEAFPDVALTKDEHLVVVFLECTHHSDRSYTRVMLSKSKDRGRTWSEKKPLTPPNHGKTGSWNCPRISTLSDGRLIVIVDKAEFNEFSNGVNVFYISDDQGETWKGPIMTPADGIVPDKLIELESGRWIISTHSRQKDGILCQKAWISDNQGESWSNEIIVARQKGLELCEGSITQLSSGELVCFLRENSGVGRDCYKAISKDQGQTWDGLYRVPIPACHRPVAGQLQSGMFMITHRYMQGGKGWVGYWTQNLFAAFMNETSILETKREQQSSRIIPLDFDRSPVSDIGYSGWIQFQDGEIYVAYYIVDDSPNGQIRGLSMRENDVILGGFTNEHY